MLGMVLPAGKKHAAIKPQYKVARSLRCSLANATFFSRVTGPAPTDVEKFTLSWWQKRGQVGVSQVIFVGNALPTLWVYFDTANKLNISNSNPQTTRLLTTQVFRDPTAWGHFVVVYDALNPVVNQRLRIFYNGVEITDFTTDTRSTMAAGQNTTGWNGISRTNNIARNGITPSLYFDGMLADIYNVDGQALPSTAFGALDPLTGAWVPIQYAGTYGAQGFHLDFADNSAATPAALGKDRSGNNNDFTLVNYSVAADNTNDSLFDSPTDYNDGVAHGNFPILSTDIALFSVGTVSRGGLQWLSSGNVSATATFVATPDDPNIYYFEMKQLGGTDAAIAVGNPNPVNNQPGYATTEVTRGVQYRTDGKVWTLNQNVITLVPFAIGETVGCAFQASTGKVWMIDKTGLISAVPVVAFSPLRDLCAQVSGSTGSVAVNFGQQPFKFAPQPAGAVPMCTLNLPAPTIKPMAKAVQYAGSAAVQSITGLGFRPAYLILKQSTAIAGRMFADINAKPDQPWDTNTAAAQLAAVAGFTMDADGFTLPANVANISTNGGTFTAFAFAESSANGFDLVSWKGTGGVRQIPHGLSTPPDCIWVRAASAAQAWETPVWWNAYTVANNFVPWGNVQNAGTGDSTYYTGNVSATMFEVGANLNVLNVDYVAFVFSNRPGRLRAMVYTGNGNVSGTRLAFGFKPAFVMLKKLNPTGTGNRPSFIPSFQLSDINPEGAGGQMFSALADQVQANALDRLSDGVKFRANDANMNNSAWEYGVIAFAGQAQKYARAA